MSILDIAGTDQHAMARRRAAFTTRDAFAAAILGHAEAGIAAVAPDDEAPHAAMTFAKPAAPATWRARAIVTFRRTRRRNALFKSGLWHQDWYLAENEDVLRAGVDPLRHFLDHGCYEGRAPGPDFDSRLYCTRYPDVVASGIEPWLHHALHGRREGRDATRAGRARSISGPAGSKLFGHIDTLGVDGIGGWIYDPADPGAPLELNVFIDGDLVSRAIAGSFRQDLLDLGLGHGRHGFHQSIPKRLFLEGGTLRIIVRSGTTETLFKDVRLSCPARGDAKRKRVVHLEISDLLHYLTRHRHASGIQRVQIGVLRGLLGHRGAAYDIACCARLTARSGFVDVPCDDLQALLDIIAEPARSDGSCRKAVADFRTRLAEPPRFAAADIVFTIGAPWALDNHDEAIHALKRTYAIAYFQILYDLVPISMPDVVDAGFIPNFTRAAATLFAHADHVFPISAFSDRELRGACRTLGIEPPASSVMTLGCSIEPVQSIAVQEAGDGRELGPIPFGADYVLCVGTIEPRKNHIALVKVWRRMLATRAHVPKLVLVGRIGWYMEDFLRSLQATDHLDGHVIIVSDCSDALLDQLYRRCLFTIFPSVYEGWGLPIVESFGYGKVCVCSSTTAMPEAGGALALYVDPDDIPAMVETVTRLIDDTDFRHHRERLVRERFRPTSWAEACVDLDAKLSAAIASCERAGPETPPTRATAMALDKVYRFARPGGTANAKALLRQSFDETILNHILDGSHWYDLERDRCWSCGRLARLRVLVGPGPPHALAALIELCFPDVYKGARCHVEVDGESRGSFQVEGVEAAIRLPLRAASRDGQSHSIVFALDVCRRPDRSAADNRMLGTGVLSIVLMDEHDEQAFATWRATARARACVSLVEHASQRSAGPRPSFRVSALADSVLRTTKRLRRLALRRTGGPS